MAELSRSEEDYLSDLYRIGNDGEPVSTGDMARRLGVTPPSAHAAFKRLARDGLITYHEYSGACLTESGELAALSVVRRHRIIERFLTDMLHFDWEEVDHLAHTMEHAMPDDVVDRLESLLGGPPTCPHGHPIPDKDGSVAPESLLDLGAVEVGKRGLITEVDEFDPELLKYLRECGLMPGAEVLVRQKNPVDRTILVTCNGKDIAVGLSTLRAVHVVAL